MINIAELLKDAPKGMKLYSPLLGEVDFAEVMDTDYVPIRVMKHGYGSRFDEYGRYMGNEYPDSECLLFPSKDCRTWEGWKPPVEPKFKAEDRIVNKSDKSTIYRIIALHEELRKYIVDIEHKDHYESCPWIAFEDQDDYELAPKPHYDIKNFHAGMPVLVRADNDCSWDYSVFSRITGNEYWHFSVCNGVSFTQCIPLNDDTKHLLGTTDMCPEEYINW